MGIALLLALNLFAFNGARTQVADFDKMQSGVTPPGWSLINVRPAAPIHWEVLNDRTAPSRPNVLALLSKEKDRHIPALAIYDGVDCRDGEVSVAFRLDPKRRSQTIGVIWRYQDPKNYYLANASAERNEISLVRVQDGKSYPLTPINPRSFSETAHHIEPNDWNLIRVKFFGTHFALYFGHRKLLEADDSIFVNAGKTGVWSRGDTVAYFDNFRVEKRD